MTLNIRAIGVLLSFQEGKPELKVHWIQLNRKVTVSDRVEFTYILTQLADPVIPIMLSSIWRTKPEEANKIFDQLSNEAQKLKTNEPKELPQSFINKVLREIEERTSFWWLQANTKIWNVESFKIGSEQEYSTHSKNNTPRRVFDYFFDASIGDLIIIYESSPSRCIKALAEVTKPGRNRDGDMFRFRIIYFFGEQPAWTELMELSSFRNTSLAQNNQGSLFKLEKEVFVEVLKKN